MVGRFGLGTGNPVLEGWHSKHRGEVERGGEAGGDEIDSRRTRVAFGDNRRSDKTGRERGTGGRNKKRRRSSYSFMAYVRANTEDLVWVSEVLEHGAGEFETQSGQGNR